MTSCDVYVLHAELLAVVGVGCAREGQQQHVDEGGVGLTCSGGDPRLVVVPNLITERDGLDAGRTKCRSFHYHHLRRNGKIGAKCQYSSRVSWCLSHAGNSVSVFSVLMRSPKMTM